MTTGDFGDGEDRPINKSYWPMRIPAKHLFRVSLIELRRFLSDARNQECQETEYGMPISARDAVFKRYGCSLEEAEMALACIDLAELQAWDETALMDAVVVGYGGDDERVAQDYGSRESLARRISLAVKFEKAPELMSPADGVFLLCRANIPFFPPLLVAVASRQLLSAATRHNYSLLMRLLEPGQTSAIADTAPAQSPATPGPVTVGNLPDAVERTQVKRRTWRDVAWLYVVETFKAGQYSTAKDFYRALENRAGTNGSPFDKGTGVNSHSLYVREMSETVTLKTIQNAWAEIKANW